MSYYCQFQLLLFLNALVFNSCIADNGGGYSASVSNSASDGFWYAAPKVTVAANGDWVMTYANNDEYKDNEIGIGVSDNEGETWINKGIISNDPTINTAQPLIIKYPDGNLDCFYISQHPTTGSRLPSTWVAIMVSRSTDNGQTWGSFQTAHSVLNDDLALLAQAVTIGTTVYVAATMHTEDPINFQNAFYKTEDNGTTWIKVSKITNGVIDVNEYAEPGLIHINAGEFVTVHRHIAKGYTLQRRTIDYGVSWSTDGYIKTDGSVRATTGDGPNLLLHQIRIHKTNEYIVMYATRYPGSYPRDVMLYFSNDDCASWGIGSEIHHGISGTEGDYVPTSVTTGKIIYSYNRMRSIAIDIIGK